MWPVSITTIAMASGDTFAIFLGIMTMAQIEIACLALYMLGNHAGRWDFRTPRFEVIPNVQMSKLRSFKHNKYQNIRAGMSAGNDPPTDSIAVPGLVFLLF